MLLVRNLSDVTGEKLKPCVAAIGFFDGVHRGHRYLIDQVRGLAAAKGLRSAIITFPTHPRNVMNATYKPELLTSYADKLRLLETTGIDYAFVLDFTPQVSHLTAYDFMRSVLKESYQVQGLIIGYDHRFGYNRSDGFTQYVEYGNTLGIEVVRARACIMNKVTVSSSAIRRLLQMGDVTLAANYLGYEYFLDGIVVGGYKVGRTLGFPTANLSITDPDRLIPVDGVYAVRVTINNTVYAGMLNIGHRPTINNGDNRSIEVHILNFHADIYNCPIHISFVQRIRPEMKFTGKDELIQQLNRDAMVVRQLLD